jgi:predicted MFS family arabinose efflux permease
MKGIGENAASQSVPGHLTYTIRHQWIYLAVLSLISMWNYVDRIIMSVLLEPIKKEFGASDAQMGLLTGMAFALSYAACGIPVARLSDRGDRRLIVVAAVAIWSFFTMCCGLAGSFGQLALARIGVGLGESGSMPPSQSLIADYFRPEQRTMAFGVFMVSAMVGNMIAFTVGTQLAVAFGWRMAFIGLGAPGLLIAVLAWLILKEPRQAMGAGIVREPQESFATNLRVLARKRSYLLVNFSMIMFYCVSYGATSWFPAYLARVMKMGLAEVGSVYGPAYAVATLLGTVLGGVMTDWLAARDRRWLGWLPALALLISFPLFEMALQSTSIAFFIVMACIGIAFLTSALPGMLSLLHAVCGAPRRAMAVAMLYFFANLLGLSLGPLITGMISDHFNPGFGAAGLRFGLMAATVFLLPASLVLLAAGSLIERDAEA